MVYQTKQPSWEDLGVRGGELTVRGKGNKKRPVYMGSTARRALWCYLEPSLLRAAASVAAHLTIYSLMC
jgi:site-specific recombinase XerD